MLKDFFTPRIGLKPLVDLCRRLSTATGAGIDTRQVWQREAQRAIGPLRRRLLDVSAGVNHGEALADALAPTGNFFPPLFRELIDVGEQTGSLDVILAQLAEHYQGQLTMRRRFLAAITWPAVELTLAVLIVGALIWIMGMLPQHIDILGFGLVGNRGLRIYITFLALVGGCGWLVVRAVSRGLVWVQPVQRLVMRLPVIGGALQTMALSRLAWSMHLTMNTGMDVRRAMKLSLRSTRNARYIGQIPAIDAEIAAGNSIHEAFCRAGGYPRDFLDTLAVGEESGNVVESMGTLARQYLDRARLALTALAVAAGLVVWMAVAALIIVLIFRIFSFYVGAINDASKP